MLRDYHDLASAKRAVRRFSLALSVLAERSPEQAKRYLERDVERATALAEGARRTGDVAASQKDWRGREIGRQSKEASPYFTEASRYEAAARAASDAIEWLGADPQVLRDNLDAASKSVEEFMAEADRKKGQGVMF